MTNPLFSGWRRHSWVNRSTRQVKCCCTVNDRCTGSPPLLTWPARDVIRLIVPSEWARLSGVDRRLQGRRNLPGDGGDRRRSPRPPARAGGRIAGRPASPVPRHPAHPPRSGKPIASGTRSAFRKSPCRASPPACALPFHLDAAPACRPRLVAFERQQRGWQTAARSQPLLVAARHFVDPRPVRPGIVVRPPLRQRREQDFDLSDALRPVPDQRADAVAPLAAPMTHVAAPGQPVRADVRKFAGHLVGGSKSAQR